LKKKRPGREYKVCSERSIEHSCEDGTEIEIRGIGGSYIYEPKFQEIELSWGFGSRQPWS
jgi:hypothetical protein